MLPPIQKKARKYSAQCLVRSRCVVGDRALNDENAGKMDTGQTSRGVRRLPQARTSRDWRAAQKPSGPALLQAPPLPLQDVHSASEMGMVQPKADYRRNCFSATNKRPIVTLFYRLMLRCTHSRKYPGFALRHCRPTQWQRPPGQQSTRMEHTIQRGGRD